MKITIFIILLTSLLVTVVKFFTLSIQTGINSGLNKALKIEPSEEDLQQEKSWNRWRVAYVVLSIISLTYAAYLML